MFGRLFVLTLLIGSGYSARVLFVAPFPALSHYQMLEPLILGLVQKGHHATVVSHYPQKNKIQNLTDVDLRGIFPKLELDFSHWSLINDAVELFAYGSEHCKTFASSETIQNFIKIQQEFDLIFIEAFDSDCFLGLVARFKAPFILFSAMPLPVWESDWIYNPTEPNYLPDNLCRLAGRMSFQEKLKNVACHLFFRGLQWLYNSRLPVEMARKYFHVDVDTFGDIKRNVSFIFANSYHGVSGVRPFLPNILEIGGIHIKPPKPLPRNIEQFLNESSEGVIVVSMGSIVKSHTLNPEIRKGFLSAFRRLKQRVLWKWEAELPDKPDNVMIVPWLPQSDVLGHPNVKLFISHGGIHGLYEAVYHGVPIIGIPLFGDQIGNLKTLALKNTAVVVEFNELNEKTLSTAINEVLGNVSYKENAETLSKIFRDQPQTPLERAIFWTEYAIRHKGAPHFKNGALELSWMQYALIDVLFVCFSFCIIFIVVFHYSLKFLRII